jgi:hypothetical protein
MYAPHFKFCAATGTLIGRICPNVLSAEITAVTPTAPGPTSFARPKEV